jgi:hypothetical protein
MWWSAVVGGGAVALALVTGCSGQVNAHWTGDTTGSATNGSGSVQGSATQPTSSGTAGDPDVATDSGTESGSDGKAKAAGTASALVSRCHTADLSVRMGTPAYHLDGGSVPLVYTNVSGHTCTMDGFGGVDLHGPADPNGPVDSLRRDPDVQGRDAADLPRPTLVRLAPGGTAHTLITFRSPAGGDIGSSGSTSWTPTEVVCTPPDETTTLSTPWLHGVGVLRQDSATVSDTYLGPVQVGSA